MRQFSRKKRVPEIRQRNHRQPLFWLLIWQEEQATNLLHIWRGVRPTQVFFFPPVGKTVLKFEQYFMVMVTQNEVWEQRVDFMPCCLPIFQKNLFSVSVLSTSSTLFQSLTIVYTAAPFFFSTPFIVSEPSFFGLPLWTEDQRLFRRLPRLSISLGILNYSSSWMRH